MRPHRQRDASKPSTLALAAISLVLHASVALFMGRYAGTGGALTPREPNLPVAAPPPVSFALACTVDVGASVAAELALCASPLTAEGEACARAAAERFQNELILCEMQQPDMPALAQIDPAEIQLMTPEAIAAIKPQPIIPALPPADPQELAKLEEKKIEEKLEEVKRQEMRPSASAQIVEITRPELEMRPDKARFVSEYDSKVERERVARASTDEMVARPGGKETKLTQKNDTPQVFKTGEAPPDPSASGERPGREGQAGAAGLLAMRGPEARSQSLNRGALQGAEIPSADGYQALKGSDRRPDIRPQTGGGGGEGGEGGDGGARVPNLRPSDDVLQKMVGGGSVDKLDGVEPGLDTALNSHRWKYATFFNRLKRRVAQNWHPGELYLRRDPTGRVYGSKDRLTVLTVSLSPTGELAGVVVAEGSGVDFLDDEAVRAFRAAQPFPNPPAGLVDRQTQLITFSFGFHFAIGGASDSWWKLRRY